LARLDRRRKKRTSDTEWKSPSDPDAKITKMKDGRRCLAHNAEHAVELATGGLVPVALQGADVGDPTSLPATAIAAADAVGVRSYIAEPDHGRGLLTRHALGRGTPCGLQDRRRPLFALWLICTVVLDIWTRAARHCGTPRSMSRDCTASSALAATW
jgi:transposase